jgi:hypothetical protein
VALAIWQLTEAIWGHHGASSRSHRARRRVASVGEAAVFGVLAYSAIMVATSGSAPSGQQTLTAKVLALPYGQILVGVVGAVVVVIGGFLVHRGIRRKFLEDLDFSSAGPTGRRVATRLGQIGYPALGVAYGTVGVLIVVAAVTHNPNSSGGLDTALKTLAAQPYGKVLLALVAAGLACFGAYCLFDARYRKD